MVVKGYQFTSAHNSCGSLGEERKGRGHLALRQGAKPPAPPVMSGSQDGPLRCKNHPLLNHPLRLVDFAALSSYFSDLTGVRSCADGYPGSWPRQSLDNG